MGSFMQKNTEKEYRNRYNSPVLRCDECAELWFIDKNEDVEHPVIIEL